MNNINIFIHGLGSNKKVWNSIVKYIEIKLEDTNNKKFLQYEDEYTDTLNFEDNIYYTHLYYDSEIVSFDGIFKDIKGVRSSLKDKCINDLVGLLVTKVKNLKKMGFEKINIVSHSLGGIMTMRYILDNEKHNINNIVYIASPFQGSENSNLLYNIYESIFLNWLPFRPTRILKQLKTNSTFINKLKSDIYKNSNILKKINTYYLYGINDGRILNSEKLVKRFAQYEAFNCEHSNIIQKKDNSNNIAYGIIYDMICDTKRNELIDYCEVTLEGVKYNISKNVITKATYDIIISGSNENYNNSLMATVDWNKAIDFCNSLSQKEGLDVVYDKYIPNFNKNGYRLLSKSEYEILENNNYFLESDTVEWCSDMYPNGDVVTSGIGKNKINYRRKKTLFENDSIGFRICKKVIDDE